MTSLDRLSHLLSRDGNGNVRLDTTFSSGVLHTERTIAMVVGKAPARSANSSGPIPDRCDCGHYMRPNLANGICPSAEPFQKRFSYLALFPNRGKLKVRLA